MDVRGIIAFVIFWDVGMWILEHYLQMSWIQVLAGSILLILADVFKQSVKEVGK